MRQLSPVILQQRLEFWRQQIQQCQQSGQTVQAWCAANNLSPKAYYYRLRKLRSLALQEPAQAIVALSPVSAPQPREVLLKAQGLTIHIEAGAAPETIQALVSALLRPC